MRSSSAGDADAFAEVCREVGLTFIGPEPEVIRKAKAEGEEAEEAAPEGEPPQE